MVKLFIRAEVGCWVITQSPVCSSDCESAFQWWVIISLVCGSPHWLFLQDVVVCITMLGVLIYIQGLRCRLHYYCYLLRRISRTWTLPFLRITSGVIWMSSPKFMLKGTYLWDSISQWDHREYLCHKCSTLMNRPLCYGGSGLITATMSLSHIFLPPMCPGCIPYPSDDVTGRIPVFCVPPSSLEPGSKSPSTVYKLPSFCCSNRWQWSQKNVYHDFIFYEIFLVLSSIPSSESTYITHKDDPGPSVASLQDVSAVTSYAMFLLSYEF